MISGSRRWLGAVGVLVAIAATIGGLAQVEIDTGVDSFVPRGDAALEATNRVAESFGGDPVVVLLESKKPHALLDKANLPALLRLEGNLAGIEDVAAVYGPATVLNQIAKQAQLFLAELVGARDALRSKGESEARKKGLSDAEIKAAGQRATESFDKRYLPLISQGLPGGLPTLHNQKFISSAVFNADGDPRPQWDFVVPNSRAVAIVVRPNADIRQADIERLVTAVESAVDDSEVKGAKVTVSGVPTIVAALGERVRQDAVVLGIAALVAVGAWFAFSRWAVGRARAVPVAVSLAGTAVTLAASGWLGIAVSLGAAAFLPVLLGVGSDFMIYLMSRVRWRVVAAAAVATSASFAALAVTPIPAVRQLGLTLAVGVLVTFGLSAAVRRIFDVSVSNEPNSGAIRRPARQWRLAAGVAAVAVASVGWALLPKLDLAADFESLATDLPAYSDARHVEEVMGASGEITVVLRGADTVTPTTYQWMRDAEAAIVSAHGDELQPILTPPLLFRFLGTDPSAAELDASMRLLPAYLTSSVIRSDQKVSVLSFGVKLEDAQQLRRLRDDVRESLPKAPPGISVELAGLPMVAVSAYESLSSDRYLNAGLGIVAAGLVLLIALSRRRDAVVAIVAAAVTTGIVLSGMWLLGIGLNPITAAVGSLAAAVACEFTVVLLERARTGASPRSVHLAAAASATGYGVLAFSGVSVVAEFGLLLAVTVVVAAAVAQLAAWSVAESETGAP